MTTFFVTGNKTKLEVAVKTLEPYGITVEQLVVETPEIQDTDVEKIASYSAKYAAERSGKSVFLTDVGYYIPALNGFPGPFVKFVQGWLRAEDFLDLMNGKEDRRIEIHEAIAYCRPGNEPVVFSSNVVGTLETQTIGEADYPFDTIVRLPDLNRVQTQCTKEEVLDFWSKNLLHYHQMGEYLQSAHAS